LSTFIPLNFGEFEHHFNKCLLSIKSELRFRGWAPPRRFTVAQVLSGCSLKCWEGLTFGSCSNLSGTFGVKRWKTWAFWGLEMRGTLPQITPRSLGTTEVESSRANS
jgi:hypothetical protein